MLKTIEMKEEKMLNENEGDKQWSLTIMERDFNSWKDKRRIFFTFEAKVDYGYDGEEAQT